MDAQGVHDVRIQPIRTILLLQHRALYLFVEFDGSVAALHMGCTPARSAEYQTK
jgi:hypothetical protein